MPTTLTARQLKDEVGKEDTKDYYRFELLNFRNVELTLDSDEANANLFLGDAQGNLIANSSNQGNVAESITQILAPGTYYILVRSVRAENNTPTTYELNLQPEELVTGSLTNIWGTSEGMISARHQEHMWVTEDGSLHLVAKLGNGGLSLFSSFDQGASWEYILTTENKRTHISTINLFYSEDEGLNWQDSGVTLATANFDQRKSGRIIAC